MEQEVKAATWPFGAPHTSESISEEGGYSANPAYQQDIRLLNSGAKEGCVRATGDPFGHLPV